MRAKLRGRRPKGRLREPYRQGDLDGLCGIYSAINAVRALSPEIDVDDACWLFDHLVQHLPKAGGTAGAVANGIDCGVEGRLLLKAARYMADEHDIDLTVRRLPTGVRRAGSIDLLWAALAKALAPTCVAVIGLEGRHSHWTVAAAATPRAIRLYDSGNIAQLRRRDCTVRKTANRVRLSPAQVFLVRRRDAE